MLELIFPFLCSILTIESKSTEKYERFLKLINEINERKFKKRKRKLPISFESVEKSPIPKEKCVHSIEAVNGIDEFSQLAGIIELNWRIECNEKLKHQSLW